MNTIDYVAFSIIIDDIVSPDGSTQMGVIGGGGPQTAFGMRLWSDSVGIAAGVGYDLPPEVVGWMDRSGVNKSGLRWSDLPTPRAWQVVEKDDRRTQVWRVPEKAVLDHENLKLKNLSQNYQKAKGYHFGIHPLEIDFDFIDDLRKLGSLVSVEPFKAAEYITDSELLEKLLGSVNIFSPNLFEAASLVGENTPLGLLTELRKFDPEILVLRMGARGSLVLDGKNRKGFHVPAVEVKVVDPVGAGNAYCGSFLVGWAETHDILTAGLYGTVAGSFLVEQVGVPIITPRIIEEANKRLESIRYKTNQISI